MYLQGIHVGFEARGSSILAKALKDTGPPRQHKEGTDLTTSLWRAAADLASSRASLCCGAVAPASGADALEQPGSRWRRDESRSRSRSRVRPHTLAMVSKSFVSADKARCISSWSPEWPSPTVHFLSLRVASHALTVHDQASLSHFIEECSCTAGRMMAACRDTNVQVIILTKLARGHHEPGQDAVSLAGRAQVLRRGCGSGHWKEPRRVHIQETRHGQDIG